MAVVNDAQKGEAVAGWVLLMKEAHGLVFSLRHPRTAIGVRAKRVETCMVRVDVDDQA